MVEPLPASRGICRALFEAADERDELLLALTPGEQLSMSAFVRGLTRQGARLVADSEGAEGVVDRVVRQLYGDSVAGQLRARRGTAQPL